MHFLGKRFRSKCMSPTHLQIDFCITVHVLSASQPLHSDAKKQTMQSTSSSKIQTLCGLDLFCDSLCFDISRALQMNQTCEELNRGSTFVTSAVLMGGMGFTRANLRSHIVDNKDGTRKFHQAIVSIVHLQIYWQQGHVPITGYEDQIAISITDTPAWYVPRHLQLTQHQ